MRFLGLSCDFLLSFYGNYMENFQFTICYRLAAFPEEKG
jgi:hypothetical protein